MKQKKYRQHIFSTLGIKNELFGIKKNMNYSHQEKTLKQSISFLKNVLIDFSCLLIFEIYFNLCFNNLDLNYIFIITMIFEI